MSRQYTLREGECIDSVAAKYGLFPQQVWDDAGNADLKKLRKDPNILQPGDVLVIPDKQLKEESGQADQRHRFRRGFDSPWMRMARRGPTPSTSSRSTASCIAARATARARSTTPCRRRPNAAS